MQHNNEDNNSSETHTEHTHDESERSDADYVVPRHEYPPSIAFFGYCVAALLIIGLPHFLLHQVPPLQKARAEMYHATALLNAYDFDSAASAYEVIVEKYPRCKQAKVQLAKCYFGLSREYFWYYDAGMDMLKGEYSPAELKEILAWVPAEYKDDFDASFKWERT